MIILHFNISVQADLQLKGEHENYVNPQAY